MPGSGVRYPGRDMSITLYRYHGKHLHILSIRNELPAPLARDFGARVLELREVLGYTQAQLASCFGRGWKQVSAWENGRATPPGSVVVAACVRCGWPPAMFTEGGERPAAALRKRATGPPVHAPDLRLAGEVDTVAATGTVDQVFQLAGLAYSTYMSKGTSIPPDEAYKWLRQLYGAALRDRHESQ